MIRARRLREANLRKTFSRRTLMFLAGAALAASTVGPAHAASVSFTVALSGAQQVPPVTTAGKGTADLTWNPATRVVAWSITYGDLSSAATMAHFHRGGEGKNGPVVIWLTTRGQAPSSPITGSTTLTPAQAAQFTAGDWYINLHTKDHPAGELRGQVIVPKG
jgi:CHRD domain